jgi:hypothetical protein
MPDNLITGQDALQGFEGAYGRPAKPSETINTRTRAFRGRTSGARNARSRWTARMSGRHSGKILGLAEVERNIRELARTMEANVRPAMTEVVAFITRESMERTPIRTGFLRASHRCKVVGSKVKTVGWIFVLANYALWVHEASRRVHFRSPWPRGRKFLERAVTDNLVVILAIIRKWMTIGRAGKVSLPAASRISQP